MHVHALEAKMSPRKPLFKRAIIQSGAIGTLGPTSMGKAGKHLAKLCDRLGLRDDNDGTKLTKLKQVSSSDIVRACRKLIWYLFPLVNDNLTLSLTSDTTGTYINLEADSTSAITTNTKKSSPKTIDIMIGEVDVEVRLLFPLCSSISVITSTMSSLRNQ